MVGDDADDVATIQLGGRLTASNGKGAIGLTVGDLMTKTVVTIAPEATIRQAANLLRGHIIGCLVVLDGAKPVGIVTTTDLLELLGRGAERPQRSVDGSTRWTLGSRGPRRSGPSLRHAGRG